MRGRPSDARGQVGEAAPAGQHGLEFGKRTIFNFAAHRRPDQYRLIVERTGAIAPD